MVPAFCPAVPAFRRRPPASSQCRLSSGSAARRPIPRDRRPLFLPPGRVEGARPVWPAFLPHRRDLVPGPGRDRRANSSPPAGADSRTMRPVDSAALAPWPTRFLNGGGGAGIDVFNASVGFGSPFCHRANGVLSSAFCSTADSSRSACEAVMCCPWTSQSERPTASGGGDVRLISRRAESRTWAETRSFSSRSCKNFSADAM